MKGGSYGSSSFINNMLQWDNKIGGGSLVVQYDPTDNGGKKGDIGIGFKGDLGGAKVYAAYNNQAGASAPFTDQTY